MVNLKEVRVRLLSKQSLKLSGESAFEELDEIFYLGQPNNIF